MATSTGAPIYYELSWSILSTIGMVNCILGFLVAGITSFSPISAVPIVVSAAGAAANGLCYYAFYADYSTTPTLVAAAFAEVFWLIQEAGLSFYSYQILIRILSNKARRYFVTIFWFLIVVIAAVKTAILAYRQMLLRSPTPALQLRIDRLHTGYFISIAIVEIVSAFFLLRMFLAAQAARAVVAKEDNNPAGSLFRTLIRSTEIRLATLALVGITRAITYSFQEDAQSAQGVSGQVDRFAYSLECMFPIVMMIDIMASKLHATIHNESSARTHINNGTHIGGPNRIRATTTTVVSYPNDGEQALANKSNIGVNISVNGRRHSNGFIRMDTLDRKGNWESGREVPLVVRAEVP